jgi:hypothetical protein
VSGAEYKIKRKGSEGGCNENEKEKYDFVFLSCADVPVFCKCTGGDAGKGRDLQEGIYAVSQFPGLYEAFYFACSHEN